MRFGFWRQTDTCVRAIHIHVEMGTIFTNESPAMTYTILLAKEIRTSRNSNTHNQLQASPGTESLTGIEDCGNLPILGRPLQKVTGIL